MSMDPPKILLEATFLRAVAEPSHERHHEACRLYEHLVRRYRDQEVLLVAVGDHLRDLELGRTPETIDKVRWFVHRAHRGLFAPVDALYVGAQHRRAAAATPVDDDRVALTLVMADRAKVRRIATLDPTYDDYSLERVELPVGAGSGDDAPQDPSEPHHDGGDRDTAGGEQGQVTPSR